MSSGHDGESPGSVNQQADGTGSQEQAGPWGTEDKVTGQGKDGEGKAQGNPEAQSGMTHPDPLKKQRLQSLGGPTLSLHSWAIAPFCWWS